MRGIVLFLICAVAFAEVDNASITDAAKIVDTLIADSDASLKAVDDAVYCEREKAFLEKQRTLLSSLDDDEKANEAHIADLKDKEIPAAQEQVSEQEEILNAKNATFVTFNDGLKALVEERAAAQADLEIQLKEIDKNIAKYTELKKRVAGGESVSLAELTSISEDSTSLGGIFLELHSALTQVKPADMSEISTLFDKLIVNLQEHKTAIQGNDFSHHTQDIYLEKKAKVDQAQQEMDAQIRVVKEKKDRLRDLDDKVVALAKEAEIHREDHSRQAEMTDKLAEGFNSCVETAKADNRQAIEAEREILVQIRSKLASILGEGAPVPPPPPPPAPSPAPASEVTETKPEVTEPKEVTETKPEVTEPKEGEGTKAT